MLLHWYEWFAIYTTGKNIISGKHHRNSCILYFDLLEMAWYQPQTIIVTLVLVTHTCNVMGDKGYYLPKFRRNLQVCSFNGLLLAKIYNFGKYVRLSVCYLPKLTFWQVCWMVVFVYLCVITCQNLHLGMYVRLLLAKIYNFWQVCSFVGLSVCLSICLSVCLFVCQFCQA